ncbi:MAG: dihydrodipicolinate synthase family protein [Mucilaginibacter polytrichastri]|nr:dihydrodipicolinate synthase family protein [Mucilaginibacter polytrichastri]
MSKPDWLGVYPALLTPFLQNEDIDFALFKKNLDEQIAAGVDGIVLCGSLGEASTLSQQEKIELLRFSLEETKGGLPVIMNIAEQSTRDAVAAAQLAEKEGAHGLMLLPPLRYNADDRETLAFFSTVATSTSLPIMIYNNPVDYKILVTLDMFGELAKLPNVQAVKESSRDISNVTRMFNRFGNRFKVLTGVDPLAMESLCMGADGWVAGLVDAFPRETVAIFRLVKAGRYEEALKIYRWFLPLLELDIHPKLVQYIKLAAEMTGIGSAHVRAPRLSLQGEELQRITAVIQNALDVRPELPDYLSIEKTALH